MAGDEPYILAQRPELGDDALYELLVVSPWQIGSSHRPCEQYIADHSHPRCRLEEDHMSGCVAGAMPDGERLASHFHRVAVTKPAIGGESPALEAEHAGLHGYAVYPPAIALMRSLYRHGQTLGQLGDAAGMVQMAVGDQNLFDLDPMLVDHALDTFEITAWIDDGTAKTVGIIEDGAVLLERGDRNNQITDFRPVHATILGGLSGSSWVRAPRRWRCARGWRVGR